MGEVNHDFKEILIPNYSSELNLIEKIWYIEKIIWT